MYGLRILKSSEDWIGWDVQQIKDADETMGFSVNLSFWFNYKFDALLPSSINYIAVAVEERQPEKIKNFIETETTLGIQ